MKFLLDTHLILWAAAGATELPKKAAEILDELENTPLFSVVSIWEIVIKNGLERADFNVDARLLRRSLLDAGYEELPILSSHVLQVAQLPAIHRDPFDRLLVAQSITEGITFLTHDATVAQYAGPIRLV